MKHIEMKLGMRLLWLLPLLTMACAHESLRVRLPTQEITPNSSPKTASLDPLRDKLVRTAANFVGRRELTAKGVAFRRDCSGAVRAIFSASDLALPAAQNSTKAIFHWVKRVGEISNRDPQIGDFVFFDNTFDQNRDGKKNDPLSHIGIVESILENKTVVFIHFMEGTLQRSFMNLEHPHQKTDPNTKERLNDMLRRRKATAAELFAGFGHLDLALL